MKSRTAHSLLSWMLMVFGCGLMVAFFFVLLPADQMKASHAWLGLGEFPDVPISFYLARSTSLLYGVHGVMMFACGRNLNSYLSAAPLFGWLHIAIGLTMFGIDLTSGMPWWWTAIEGLPVAASGGVIVWLHRIAVSDKT